MLCAGVQTGEGRQDEVPPVLWTLSVGQKLRSRGLSWPWAWQLDLPSYQMWKWLHRLFSRQCWQWASEGDGPPVGVCHAVRYSWSGLVQWSRWWSQHATQPCLGVALPSSRKNKTLCSFFLQNFLWFPCFWAQKPRFAFCRGREIKAYG